jgi:hypothetical protein
MAKIGALLLLLATLPLKGEALELRGFLQLNWSLNIASENPTGGDFKWAEERLQVEALTGHGKLKAELFHDHVEGAPGAGLRELYLDWAYGALQFRAGRQVLTWGLGELVFLNDLFPKDYQALFAGRPLQYLRKPVDALWLALYPQEASVDVVLIPRFEPDELPGPERFHVPAPPGAEEPPVSLENLQVALRALRNFGGWDTALYFYKGFTGQPPYRRLLSWGLSLEGPVAGGVGGLEASLYRAGLRQGRLLLRYEAQLARELTASLQGYLQEGGSHVLSLKLLKQLWHQSLTLRWLSLWSPDEGDYLLLPQVRYRLSDTLWLALGAVLPGGSSKGQFGSLGQDKVLYSLLRWGF